MGKQFDYDMVIIGSGPAGQRAAIQAGKLGKRVAVVEGNPRFGGVCLHDGTVPSKSFREAIMHLSGFRERAHYGQAYRVKEDISMTDLTSRCSGIESECEQTVRSQIIRNKVQIIEGFAQFEDAHHVRVIGANFEKLLSTEFVLIATGTRPVRPAAFEFDGRIIHDSDTILHFADMPKTMSIVGGGVIGCEYGSMFAALGVKVTIVEARSTVLGFVDREMVEALVYTMRQHKVQIITDDKVIRCAVSPDGRAVTYLESGKRVVTDILLVSAGRQGNVEKLNLQSVGIKPTDRGTIAVNENFQTSVENIYAVGDVVGAPALASTGLEQGRRAACHAFGLRDKSSSIPLPFGVYTIPEIAMIGKTESELSSKRVPYEVGIARFGELDRGKIIGDDCGVLKILFDRHSLKILGVHIIGESACELIHVGQAVMGLDGGIDFLAQAVFNYPTLAQAYKTAALDGLNKVIATSGLTDDVSVPEHLAQGAIDK